VISQREKFFIIVVGFSNPNPQILPHICEGKLEGCIRSEINEVKIWDGLSADYYIAARVNGTIPTPSRGR
jgi:hypothetical protein